MLKPKYLIDTVILIDHLNGVDKATKWLARLKGDEAVISVITRAEVLAGTALRDMEKVLLLLDKYPCFSITTDIADRCAKLRHEYHWKLPDSFQAALALENNLNFVTRNTKDFSERDHSFVKVPYTL